LLFVIKLTALLTNGKELRRSAKDSGSAGKATEARQQRKLKIICT
jgi:hypothetical protein